MEISDSSTNYLLTTKAPDTPLSVQLHPLVLLTLSDYITRHTSRRHEGPIVGAIIGQQTGQAVTLEHAYECKLAESPDDSTLVDADFFADRLEQYKDVHKTPALDLVGVFMLGSALGPLEVHANLVKQVQAITSNDSVMLLLFQPQLVDAIHNKKLPITLYESLQEQDGSEVQLKFREVTFEVETGDAEMIGVDFVAKGGGNATAVPKAEKASTSAASAEDSGSREKKLKGKGKAKDKDGEEADAGVATTTTVLSPEDEELIASLTAKVNAIKMLNQRLLLIRSYLLSHQSSYLTDPALKELPSENTNHVILRSINAMLSRLPLLTPPSASRSVVASSEDDMTPSLPPSSSIAADTEKQDVHLTSLLASLTRAISEAQSMGSKFSVVQREKQSRDRTQLSGRGGGRIMGNDGLSVGDVSGL